MTDSKIVLKTQNNVSYMPRPQALNLVVAMPTVMNSDQDLRVDFVHAKRKRGLFAKFLGSILPSRVSEKKVKNKIEQYKFGFADKKQVQDTIERYHQSNTNTSETAIDTLSSIAAISSGFVIKKTQLFANIFTSKYKNQMALLTAAASILTGFAAKLVLKGLDVASMNKEGRKEQSLRSTAITGLLDGALGYLSVLTPYAIPFSVTAGLFARYVDSKRNDKTMSSLTDFLEKQKDALTVGIIGAAGMSASAVKGHINLARIANSIKAAAINKNYTVIYRPPKEQLTEFQQLARDIGYDLSIIINGEKFNPAGIAKLDEDFMKILLEEGQSGKIDEKIKKIELENIFLPKYLQTVIDIPEELQIRICKQIDQLVEGYNSRKGHSSFNGRDWVSNSEEYTIDRVMLELEKKGMDINGLKDLQGILQKIKSKCSTSRTISEAQDLLNAEYGTQYSIIKPCGVGSVAETYVAKDNNSGEEVIIKIVKEYFLREDKIAKDKSKILLKLDERAKKDYSWFTSKQTIFSPKRKKYDIDQVENMFKVWGGEINLAQEAQAAKDIASQAQTFNAVGVVSAKRNIFIMKKAEGIPLDSDDFVKLWKEEKLTEGDYKNWVEYYVKVYCEQLFSIPKSGNKVVQSDPHCGNIFGNPQKVRDIPNGAKALTIIDYGNTTQTEQSQAIKNLFNHLDYLVGNTESIAESMLEGANLGKNNKTEVIKELSNALNESLYNPDTKIELDNPVKIFSTVNSFCLDFMQKKNIVPNASHINQMKAEETYIISNLGCMRNIADACGYDISKAIDKDAIIKLLVAEMAKATEDAAKCNPNLTYKEIMKRYNFFIKNPEEALSCLGINFGIV